ncbi:hypothetical protein ASG17_07650 [Brevundimonas sp. Leaf363]|uniref:DUF2188 domain-containing protein n=1 Tax=Brevundimonas sp. Leaf363 TaxID=1736353 RepID=UPI0006FFD0EC|nr:DUF2188 domain-containing protein [Brevundimonas sp. Leaf363]KQS55916.1 hypothetical protein ASG17_07650 [Brevundimonas sp. Leaf363]
MAKAPKRAVYHSTPDPKGSGWVVTRDGKKVSGHRKQETAEKAATKAGRRALDEGGLGQAVLHKSDGTIREERTYGSDPAKTPG